MSAIIKNNLRRLWVQKELVFLLIIFTAAACFAAVWVSTRLTQTYEIAFAGSTPPAAAASNIRFTAADVPPPFSALVLGRYDGILRQQADGSYTLETIKSDSAHAALQAALAGEMQEETVFGGRDTGVNILGFLMMFVLLTGSMAMCMYSEDKENGQLKRIAASPLRIRSYLLSQGVFHFCFLFFPVLAVLSLICGVTNTNTGYTPAVLAGLIALLCAFSAAFCMLLYTFLPGRNDTAKMTGNTIIILTSILAGSFYAFDEGNPALSTLIRWLPQKAYLTLAEALAEGAPFFAYAPALFYLLALTAAFFGASAYKIHRLYVKKR